MVVTLRNRRAFLLAALLVGNRAAFGGSGLVVLCVWMIVGCKQRQKPIRPTQGAITESVYASGILKSKGQYQAFAVVSGIIDSVYVAEGQLVSKGQKLLTITNDQQRLTSERALLAAEYASLPANLPRLQELQRNVGLAAEKLGNDSLLLARQQRLWQQKIGTLVQVEQRQLQYNASAAAWKSSQRQLADLRRQLALDAKQSRLTWAISRAQQEQFIVTSHVDGVVFDLLREKGESVGPQTVLAILGNADNYMLELQVDEYDISRVRSGAEIFVTMDSHQGQVFEGMVLEVHPIMNAQTRTFTVEAELKQTPPGLYPNLTLEANIVCAYKKNALLIPRRYLVDDSTVLRKNGDRIRVRPGLRDLEMVEVLSGLSAKDEIIQPEQ
nr:HlyD family efflux transporter periplasmic adaptor subunit [uncultured Dyadobacter sp.]